MGDEGGGPNLPVGGTLSSRELERVIRRAAELQTARETVPDGLDDAEVVRIGEEVGLDPQHVRRALIELRAESLVPEVDADRALPERAWGAARIQVSRVVPGDAPAVQDSLSRYLRKAESLRPVRDRSGLSVWEPASDLASQLKRGLDFSGRGFELAKARRIEVAVQPLEPGRSLVTMTADLRNQRMAHAGWWMFGGGWAGAAAVGGLVFGALAPPLLVVPAVVGAVGGGATYGARRTFGTLRDRVELTMNGVLDRLERGGDLPTERGSIVERIGELLEQRDLG